MMPTDGSWRTSCRPAIIRLFYPIVEVRIFLQTDTSQQHVEGAHAHADQQEMTHPTQYDCILEPSSIPVQLMTLCAFALPLPSSGDYLRMYIDGASRCGRSYVASLGFYRWKRPVPIRTKGMGAEDIKRDEAFGGQKPLRQKQAFIPVELRATVQAIRDSAAGLCTKRKLFAGQPENATKRGGIANRVSSRRLLDM